MKLEEAQKILSQIPNVPFNQLFSEEQLNNDIIHNKGKSGQLLESVILNLKLSSAHLDFDDGELKSCCFYTDGTPKETIAVCVIKSIFDDLLNEEQDYTQSYPYEKMANMLIASISKYKRGISTVLNPRDWSILQCIHVDFSNEKYAAFAAQVAEDLKSIFSQVKRDIDDGKNISTTNGKYIQIRTKDNGGNSNSPIYSEYANRYVSHCNYAIYIMKDGINEILKIAGDVKNAA